MAAELGWIARARITPDRLAQWTALRSGNLEEDGAALAKLGWALRRLSGGPGPEADLAGFLGRQEVAAVGRAPLGDRIAGWSEMMALSADLHPISRACLGFHLWPMAGIGPEGERLEAAITAGRIAAGDCRGGAIFVPLAMAGEVGLRAGSDAARRLALWFDGIAAALNAAMRLLDQLEDWQGGAMATTRDISGRTPARLVEPLISWPTLSAPMAEANTGASRAAVQRNLTLMQARGLIREVTGQGRFRLWCCRL